MPLVWIQSTIIWSPSQSLKSCFFLAFHNFKQPCLIWFEMKGHPVVTGVWVFHCVFDNIVRGCRLEERVKSNNCWRLWRHYMTVSSEDDFYCKSNDLWNLFMPYNKMNRPCLNPQHEATSVRLKGAYWQTWFDFDCGGKITKRRQTNKQTKGENEQIILLPWWQHMKRRCNHYDILVFDHTTTLLMWLSHLCA